MRTVSDSIVVNGRFLDQDVTGVQRVGRELIAALDELKADGELSGVEIEVMVPRSVPVAALPDLRHVRVRRAGRLRGHLWEQLELPLLAGRRPLLCLGNLAPVLRLLRGAHPTITMVHDLSFRYFPAAYSSAFRLLYSIVTPVVLARSSAVVTVSESERAAIRGSYPRWVREERLVAVQNGGAVDDAAAKARLGTDGCALPTVLYVGSLTQRKNVDGLLSLAERLTTSRRVRFRIVGGTAASFSSRSGPGRAESSTVELLGQVNDQQALRSIYRDASVFVFPSFYEASPLPPIEAMSAGVPVVAADIPSLRERCGDAALFVDPYDLDGLERAVVELLDDEARRRDLGERGRAHAATYSWKAQARQLVDIVGAPS